MNENIKKPPLRFKGFTEAWEQRELIQIANYRNGRAHENAISEDGKYIVINSKFVSTNGEVIKFSNLQIEPLWKNEIAFVLSDVPNGRAIARTFLVENNDKYTLNQRIAGITPLEKTNSYFLYIIMNRNPYFLQFDDGAKQTNLSKDDVTKFSTFYPILNEQEKIGVLFSNLDNLITLHQRKYDRLVNIKKGFLEKMFPQNGSSIPEIRFKGFTEAWEQREFRKCVLIQRGGSPRPIEDYITDDESGINWIKIGDVSSDSRYITKTKEKIKPSGQKSSRNVYVGDLILSNSMSFGRPYILTINGCIHDGWLLIRNDKNIFNLEYLLQLLSTDYMFNQYKSLASGGVVNNLNSELVQSTNVVIPNMGEQIKIGNMFSNLDNLITLHQRKLEKLKNIKTACLEKMFV